jgi:hypothetical protein
MQMLKLLTSKGINLKEIWKVAVNNSWFVMILVMYSSNANTVGWMREQGDHSKSRAPEK